MTSFIGFTRRKRISASIHILLGVMAAYPHAAAQAQQASGGTLPAVRVQGNRDEGYSPAAATSATKSSAPLRDIPQAVNVVPQQVIRDQAAQSVQDVLRNVPGVGMSNGDGQRDQVTIRGFSAIADQFIDGIRDDALYFRDLSNIERVEVLKGPAAVLYGRGSSGGLINRVTKKPQEGRFGELTLNAGSYGLKRTSFDANTGIADGVAVRLTGAHEDSGSFRQQGFIERHSIAPSVSAALGASTKLLVQGEFAKDKRITDFGIPSFNGRPVNVPRETYYGSSEARRDDYTATEVASVTAAIDHRFNEIVSVRNATRYYTYDLDRNNTLPGGTVDTVTRTVGRNRGQIQREEDGYFNQTDFTIRNSLGGIRQEWLLGMEFGKQNKFQQSVNQANIDRVSIFNPGGVVAPPISAATRNSLASRPRDSDFKVFGLYAQDQISLTSQLKALIGVRHDIFKQETTTAGILIPLAREDKKLSPRAGLVWQPTQTAAYYVSFSQSFQPSGEAFALADNNADSAPEKTQNREIGAKLDFLDGAISTTLALFNLERTNIKIPDPSNLARLINAGEQRTNGFEFTASGQLAQGLDIFAGYAYLDGRITKSTASVGAPQTPPARQIPLQGNRPSLTPEHSGFVWINKQLIGGFSAGGGLNYSADRFASTSNAVVLPGYVTADLAAFHRSKLFDLALNVKNVTNRKYVVSGHGGNDNLLTPGGPREFQFAVTCKF